ncbi:unnamed protein product [Vicia faba]|uniref:Uncharacterized protein n=1 Tax=Vicia faba TaxID=3906 RepID=A0AAV0YBM8_VICFA|nr:unnamed protein product [Vicia faba]
MCMDLYPGFALYCGLYEFVRSASIIDNLKTNDIWWKDLSGGANGIKGVLIIMVAEWIVMSFVVYYIDQVFLIGSGKSPLFFLKGFQKKYLPLLKKSSIKRQGSKVFVQMEKLDVIRAVSFMYIE